MNKFGLSLGSVALVLLTLLSTMADEVNRLNYKGLTIRFD
jgi:hypothetical protein